MIPWRNLDPVRQAALRDAYAEAMSKQTATCSLDEKVARFAEWLAPQGISFTEDDLPRRKG